MVVELDVGDRRDSRVQQLQRAVGLVALGHEPAAPGARVPSSCGTSPPIRKAGSSPSRSRQKAIIAAVVVLPCAPATTIDGPEVDELRQQLAAPPPRDLRVRRDRARDDHLRAVRGRRRVGPIATGIPRPRGGRGTARDAVRAADLGPPLARDQGEPLMPAPPIPTNQRRLPASPQAGGDQLLRDLVGRVRPRDPPHRGAPSPRAARVVEQRAHEVGHAASSLRARGPRRPPPEIARVLRLVVGRRERVRDEDRRACRRRRAPRRSRRAREREIGRAVRGAELVVTAAAVVRPRTRGRSSSKSRSPHRWSTAGPGAPNASTANSFSARAPERAAEDEQHRPVRGEPEDAPRLGSRQRPRARRERPARHAVLRAVAAVDRKREEDALRERRRKPVREPEVRVGLRHRRRDPAAGGREHHRAGDVAAAAEDDVGPAAFEDPRGRRRARGRASTARATGAGRRPAREAAGRGKVSSS